MEVAVTMTQAAMVAVDAELAWILYLNSNRCG
jgi:hypothetical protein